MFSKCLTKPHRTAYLDRRQRKSPGSLLDRAGPGCRGWGCLTGEWREHQRDGQTSRCHRQEPLMAATGRSPRSVVCCCDSPQRYSEENIIDKTLKIQLFCLNIMVLGNTFLLLIRKEVFYLMMHSTHFIYGYMAVDIW